MRKGAYVYDVLVDGVRRYVGKGRGRRCHMHMKKVRSIARRRAAGETVIVTAFYEKLTQAWLEGADIAVYVLVDGLSDAEAFALETTLIEQNEESLWNTTPGGQGFSAKQWDDPAFRKKMQKREASKRTPEYHAKRSAIAQSQWDDPEWRAGWLAKRWPNGKRGSKREKDRAERRLKPRWRKPRIVAIGKGPWVAKANSGSFKKGDKRPAKTPKEIASITQSNLETWSDPQLLAEQAERSKVLWLRPEYRERTLANLRAAKRTPEGHLRRSEAAKLAWQTKRAKMGGSH